MEVQTQTVVTFLEAVEAMGQRKKVTCRVDKGDPVVYQAKDGEWTVKGEVTDYRDFCFSPSQVLFGKWTIETE